MWERIKAEFRGWSLPHFLFDGFLSLLIGYVVSLRIELAWHQLALLVVLTAGTLTSVMLVMMQMRRSPSLTEKQRADEFQNRQTAIMAIRSQLLELAKLAPDQAYDSPEFMEWRELAQAFVTGALKFEIEREFGVVGEGKNPRACRQYLLAIATNLTEADLRKVRIDDW